MRTTGSLTDDHKRWVEKVPDRKGWDEGGILEGGSGRAYLTLSCSPHKTNVGTVISSSTFWRRNR